MNNAFQEIAGQVTRWIEIYFPAVCAGAMAAAISILMGIRTGEPPKRNASGATICGLVAMGCYSFAIFCGMPPEAGVFFGAYIGFRGADGVKEMFMTAGNIIKKRRSGGATDANQQ